MAKLCVHLSTIFQVLLQYTKMGSIQDKTRSVWPRTAWTWATTKLWRPRSRKIEKVDLILKSYWLRPCHFISEETAKKRLQQAKELIPCVKAGGLQNLTFSDEKLFSAKQSFSCKNDQILAQDICSLPEWRQNCYSEAGSNICHGLGCRKWRRQISFGFHWSRSQNQCCQLHCIHSWECFISWAQKTFEGHMYTFQQKVVWARISNWAQKWYKNQLVAFIPKNEWPPSSPELNPLDFSILEAKLVQMNTPVWNIRKDCWFRLGSQFLKIKSVQFALRLRVIKAKGCFIK